jgi:hypothetical protein
MVVYMLGRIAPEADHHGIRAQRETIADLLIVDLSGEDELRRMVPELLKELERDTAVIEVDGEWRLQTKESADWEATYRSEEKAILADQSGLARTWRDLLSQAIDTALAVTASVPTARAANSGVFIVCNQRTKRRATEYLCAFTAVGTRI